MSTFLIIANDANGDNLDFFVRAEMLPKAVELYRAHIAENFNEPDGEVRVFNVPDQDGKSEVIEWADLGETKL